jgi:hypothetical protein
MLKRKCVILLFNSFIYSLCLFPSFKYTKIKLFLIKLKLLRLLNVNLSFILVIYFLNEAVFSLSSL